MYPQNPILVVPATSPNTYLTRGYYGKKKGKKKEKEIECEICETGMGKLYDEIKERKSKNPFPTMDELLEVD